MLIVSLIRFGFEYSDQLTSKQLKYINLIIYFRRYFGIFLRNLEVCHTTHTPSFCTGPSTFLPSTMAWYMSWCVAHTIDITTYCTTMHIYIIYIYIERSKDWMQQKANILEQPISPQTSPRKTRKRPYSLVLFIPVGAGKLPAWTCKKIN